MMSSEPSLNHSDSILITGYAGFIGQEIGDVLTAAGHKITGVDRRLDKAQYPDPRERVVELLRCDFCHPAILDAAANGDFKAILHHAAIVDTTLTDAAKMFRENTTKSLQLAEAAAASRTPFIYASSSSVYGRVFERLPVPEDAVDWPTVCSGPLNPYGESKLQLDRVMEERHSDSPWFWAGVRYTNVFGPGEEHKGRMASMVYQMLKAVIQDRPVTLFSDTLGACRDYIPVRVAAKRIRHMLEYSGVSGVYNIGSGIAISFATLLEWCTSLSPHARVTVQLEQNPYAHSYQYWTCAATQKWNSAFGACEQFTEASIHSELLDLAHALALRA